MLRQELKINRGFMFFAMTDSEATIGSQRETLDEYPRRVSFALYVVINRCHHPEIKTPYSLDWGGEIQYKDVQKRPIPLVLNYDSVRNRTLHFTLCESRSSTSSSFFATISFIYGRPWCQFIFRWMSIFTIRSACYTSSSSCCLNVPRGDTETDRQTG